MVFLDSCLCSLRILEGRFLLLLIFGQFGRIFRIGLYFQFHREFILVAFDDPLLDAVGLKLLSLFDRWLGLLLQGCLSGKMFCIESRSHRRQRGANMGGLSKATPITQGSYVPCRPGLAFSCACSRGTSVDP